MTRTPIVTKFSGCNGNCSGNITAAGLEVDCSPPDFQPWSNKDITDFPTDVFESKFAWSPGSIGFADNWDPTGDIPFTKYPFIDFNLSYAIGRKPTYNFEYGGVGLGDNASGICNGMY